MTKIHRIEIIAKYSDTRADVRRKNFEKLGFINKVSQVFLVDVYTIDKNFTRPQLKNISGMLTNPVTQKAGIDCAINPGQFDFAIEIGFLPGVTDNVAGTAKEEIEDMLKIKFGSYDHVYTSQITFVSGKILQDEAKTIADSLYNPLIQRATIKNYSQFKKDQGMGVSVPQVRLGEVKKVDIVNLDITDEELVDIGKKGITNADGSRRGPLALDLNYMKAIQKYFKKLGRNPTDIELESLAQTWSEHCKHTIFADPIDEVKDGLFKTYIKAATDKIRKLKGKKDFCYSVFVDNSGGIEFDHDYLITHKVETHNSPSALDPYGGAITGIVGVNRDAMGFGLGAKPIINYYGYCLADPKDDRSLYKGPGFTQKMLGPRRILEGVVAGVNSGGNCSGIPTPQGFMIFDDRYKGKPLVFVGTVGLIPKKINGKKSYFKKAEVGDYIVMAGGRVGLDGIHGATFSSEAMNTLSPATAVQIGDPITQKKMSDALVKEARDARFYNSITDDGAGGLSCSVAEMAKESGGCLVELDKVPLKYPGLSPWQIWISESQERMTLAVPPSKWNKFKNLMKKRGVEATVIGKFTDSKKCIVRYHNQEVMNINMDFLHDGLPVRKMTTKDIKIKQEEVKIFPKKELTKILHKMISRLNICDFSFISSQYDYEVQASSALKPIQGRGQVGSAVSVTKPVLNSQKGIILSQGILPNYSDIDTYRMAACVIDTAIRNVVSAGASLDRIALLDNFCWCSSQDPFRLFQLKKAAKACYDYAVFYQTPFISGKDSMFNDFKGYDGEGKPVHIAIPPTLLVSSLSVVDDIKKTISLDIKFPGDLIYILGETYDELGASEYFSMYRCLGMDVPKVDASKNKKLYKEYYKCVQNNLISSGIGVGRGGLAVSLAKTALGGMWGINISLKNLPGKTTRDDYSLFSESQGRILVSVSPKNKKKFEAMVKNISYKLLGEVGPDDKFIIRGHNSSVIVNTDVKKLLISYRSTFKNY